MSRITAPKLTEDNELTRVARVAFQLESISSKLTDMDTRQAKHEAKMEQKLGDLEKTIHQMPEKYATKAEVKEAVDPVKQEVKSVKETVKEEVKEAVDPVKRDVESINSNITWATRLIVGAVIMALVGLVIAVQKGVS